MFDVNNMKVKRWVEDKQLGVVDVYEGEYKGYTFVLKAQSEIPGEDYDSADYWEITYYKDGEEICAGEYEKWYRVRFDDAWLSKCITEDIYRFIEEEKKKKEEEERKRQEEEAKKQEEGKQKV